MTQVSIVNLTQDQLNDISFALLYRAETCKRMIENFTDNEELKASYLKEEASCRTLWHDLYSHVRYNYNSDENSA